MEKKLIYHGQWGLIKWFITWWFMAGLLNQMRRFSCLITTTKYGKYSAPLIALLTVKRYI